MIFFHRLVIHDFISSFSCPCFFYASSFMISFHQLVEHNYVLWHHLSWFYLFLLFTLYWGLKYDSTSQGIVHNNSSTPFHVPRWSSILRFKYHALQQIMLFMTKLSPHIKNWSIRHIHVTFVFKKYHILPRFYWKPGGKVSRGHAFKFQQLYFNIFTKNQGVKYLEGISLNPNNYIFMLLLLLILLLRFSV